jgi:hypothetical protein
MLMDALKKGEIIYNIFPCQKIKQLMSLTTFHLSIQNNQASFYLYLLIFFVLR